LGGGPNASTKTRSYEDFGRNFFSAQASES
jgi:hypothetical protein